MGTDLAQHNGQATPTVADVDRESIELLKRHYAEKASDRELELFANVAGKLGLSPQAKQIYAISRWNNKDRRYDLSIQIGIDGLRLMAERSGQYAGSDAPLWCGPDGKWSEIWLEDAPPTAAKVTVWRKGSERPVVGVAMFKNFRESSPLWAKMPEHMLAIAAERQALRKAFPADIAAWESSVREATISVEESATEAPPALPEPPKQLPSPQPEPSPAGDRAASTLPSTAEVATPRAPESAPAGGAIEEKPAVTGFYALCQDQLHLDRAGVKALLGVTETDDTAALEAALAAREIPQTRKGLATLSEVAAALVTARETQPVADDDPMVEPVEAMAL